MNSVNQLCEAYSSSEQIDLVLGAGVSSSSGVPLYLEMALLLIKYASEEGLLPNAPSSVITFFKEQLTNLKNDSRNDFGSNIRPEEIVLFVRKHVLDSDEGILKALIQKILYEKITLASRSLVSRRTYRQNPTLDSILRFCAVLRDPADVSTSKYKIEPNPKIHAILTTNYDCLLEASFATKFRYLLKPVARETSTETRTGQRIIPVYHIHGYVSAFSSGDSKSDEDSSKLVIAEDDYFRTFYNPEGFADSKASQFFHQRTCLFIGSAMTDLNVRRFLYYAEQENAAFKALPKHFAIMRRRGRAQDEFTASILQTYGVDVIWINNFDEIDQILGQVYTSIKGMKKERWNALRKIERSGN